MSLPISCAPAGNKLPAKRKAERTRVCLLRTGVVLAPRGRYSRQMTPAFKLGLGGPIGNGRQYLAWIHIDDMVNGILWLLDNDLRGPFNMVSPYPVRKRAVRPCAAVMRFHRPAIFRVPAAAIRLLMGIRRPGAWRPARLPKRLEAAGFAFRWYDLDEALKDVLS